MLGSRSHPPKNRPGLGMRSVVSVVGEESGTAQDLDSLLAKAECVPEYLQPALYYLQRKQRKG